jgi:hypothetical protein
VSIAREIVSPKQTTANDDEVSDSNGEGDIYGASIRTLPDRQNHDNNSSDIKTWRVRMTLAFGNAHL